MGARTRLHERATLYHLAPQPSIRGQGSPVFDHGHTLHYSVINTSSSLGPCTPMVSVISISAVRDGPVINTVAEARRNCGRRRASSRDATRWVTCTMTI